MRLAGRLSVQRKAKRRKAQVNVVYFRQLEAPGGGENGREDQLLVPADEPVQLAMFAV